MNRLVRRSWLPLVVGLAAVMVLGALTMRVLTAAPTLRPAPGPSAQVSTQSASPGAAAAEPPLDVPDRYVAGSGSDTTGDGSAGNPWRTIQKAADSISGGEVVSVAAGTYDERVTLPGRASGSAGDATRLVADGEVVVTGGFDVRSDHVDLVGFEVTGGSMLVPDVSYRGQVFVRGSHVSLTGLSIHDIARASAICLLSTQSHITIQDCSIDKPRHAGISTTNGGAGDHASYVTVKDCTVQRWGGDVAIYAYGDHWLIEGCEIRGIDAGWQGAAVWNGDGIWPNYSHHSIIRDCRIYDIWPYKGYDSGEHADCIQFWTDTTDLLIEDCTLGSWRPGGPDGTPGPTQCIMFGTVSAGATCEATIQNCLFLTGVDERTHTTATGREPGATLRLRFVNNTFYGNYPELSHCTDVFLRNNVFYAHRGFGHSADSDYNAFLWMDWEGGASTVPPYEGGHSLGRTYAERPTPADIFVDPAVDAAHDYGLSADFRAKGAIVGAGDPASATLRDALGTPRSDSPSIGAYE